MRNILILLLSLFSLSVFAQVEDTPVLVGKYFGSQSGGGSGYWQISGTFTDESGLYDAGSLEVGDVVFFGDAGIGYHLPITQIMSLTAPSFVIRVNNTGISGVAAVPTGLGAIYRPRPNIEIMPYASGLTNPDQQTYMGYVMKLIDDNIGGGNIYYAGDGLLMASDTFNVDTTVARYLLYPDDIEIDDTTGLVRHKDAYGERWSSRNDRNYYYYNVVTRTGDALNKIDRSYVKSEASGGGGFAGWSTSYDPTDRFTATFEVVNNTEGSDAAIYLNSRTGSVGIRGEPDGQSAYGYDLATTQPSIDSTEVMMWDYNGDGTHTPRFHAINTVVQTYSAPITYEVTITGANADSRLFVTANKIGVTASFASNKLTVTIPSGITVHTADWHVVSADIQASADAGGTTNWVQAQFNGTGYNTDLTELRPPLVQKVAIPSSGALSVTNAATYDLDNNPAVSVVGLSSGNITLRIGGLSAGSQGTSLKFSNL